MRAVVFGGSSGIGQAIARRLAEDHADVLICARNAEKLAAAAGELRAVGGNVEWRSIDLSNRQGVGAAVGEIIDTFGIPDAIVLNGGGPPIGTFSEISVDQWENSLEELILSNVIVLKTFLARMQQGSVAFVLSDVTRAAAANKLLPCALRLALCGIMKCLALEYAARGIRFNAISPGPVETERARALLQSAAERTGSAFDQVKENFTTSLPMHRMGTPREIAEVAHFLLTTRSSYLTGVNVVCDGGLTFFPI